MEPDPVLVSNTREWLLRAKEDLDNAQHDLKATPPFVRDALFHCRQAVEKAMKALLTWHDSPFRKTHNLEELGELCTKIVDSILRALPGRTGRKHSKRLAASPRERNLETELALQGRGCARWCEGLDGSGPFLQSGT